MSDIRWIAPRTARIAAPLFAALMTFTFVPLAAGAQAAWTAPERAAKRANPVASTADVVAKGHQFFTRECEKCHGKAGHGDGPDAKTLDPRPADFSSENVQGQSDGALFWKMTQGKGMMPTAPFGENDKWTVIAFIRTLAVKK